MSLPSIAQLVAERGVSPAHMSAREREDLVVSAMRRDLPLAVELLEAKAREALNSSAPAHWIEDPNSTIGKQLIRIHASDAMRPLASKHFCNGMQLTFVNCCKGIVKPRPDEEDDTLDDIVKLQIDTQDGTIAYADC